ncbi:hypothetical protein JKF63_04907 [Porcisia hertigi]|uniref:Uncharacterized protein n=1 Tax=Porcisia hertigi TaxID=2761500 RepID=A0A836LDQ6_9TRYP|nr:hypothetical protein JKF63_04907 [Porcisia hertigi]
MRHVAFQTHASRGESISSAQPTSSDVDDPQSRRERSPAASSSSADKAVEQPPESSVTTSVRKMTVDGPEGTAASMTHPTSQGTFTDSEKRRQKTLFLGDSEQFAFDFGGAVTEMAATVAESEAAQREAQRAEELEVATARLQVLSTPHAAATRPLTLEEVSACAADAMQQGLRRFLTLTKPGSRKRAATTTISSADATQDVSASVNSASLVCKQTGDEDGITLAEAVPQFQAALRRYEADLWRADKHRREEEARQRSKSKHSQRV